MAVYPVCIREAGVRFSHGPLMRKFELDNLKSMSLTNITKTYPFHISDKDLEEQIQNLVKNVIETNTDTDGVIKLNSSGLIDLISLGQTELQKRINGRVYTIAVVAIILSVIQLFLIFLLIEQKI